MRMLFALFLLLPAICLAQGITVSWPPVTEYEDDGDQWTNDILPGAVTYELWGGVQGQVPRLLATTSATESLRTNVASSVYCYYVVALHQSPTGIERSAPSPTSCADNTSPQVPKQRTSGTPKAPGQPVVVRNP
jgi:hypothetical protein